MPCSVARSFSGLGCNEPEAQKWNQRPWLGDVDYKFALSAHSSLALIWGLSYLGFLGNIQDGTLSPKKGWRCSMPRLRFTVTAILNPLGVIRHTKVTDSRSIWKSRVLCCRNWPAWCFPTKRRQTFPAKLSLHGVLFHPILKRLGRTLGSSLFLFPGWHNWCFPVEALRVLMKHVVEWLLQSWMVYVGFLLSCKV